MQFPSRYALLVAGPLSLWSVGCSSVTHRPVTSAGPAISNADRLMSMAQVYEQKGQLEQAHKLYCQILQEHPNHPQAREHANDLMKAMSAVQSQADETEVAATKPTQSAIKVAAVPKAPTDPALLGRANRRLLSDDEVAARVPKPRAVAKSSATRQNVATVTHSETKSGLVTPAERLSSIPAGSAVVVLEEPFAVTATPEIVNIAPAQPAAIEEAAPQQFAPAEPTALAMSTTTSAPISITVTPAGQSAWTKTSLKAKCPNAPAHLQDLLSQLSAADPEARKAALEEIVNSGPEAATCLPAIRATLTEADPIVQAHAAWALWNITGESGEAVGHLCRILKCDQEEAVVFACYVLGTMGRQAESAVGVLAALQDDDSNAVRVHASEAMLKVSHEGALAMRVLTASLSSHRADERSLAAVAMGAAVGDNRQAAISALITALYDSDPGVRSSAALALGGFGADASSAISALEVAAAATDEETREAATTALACIRK